MDVTSQPRTSLEKLENREPDRNVPSQDGAMEVYPNGPSLAAITIGLFLAILCFGLDRSILATAIPKITSDFNSLKDVAWYGSAYLFTQCSFQLLFGKLYAEYNIKWIFLAGLGIFEAGSVVCAAAPSSVVLIIGRAVSGAGAAGLMTGALIIITKSVPLHKRPTYTAAIGAAAGVSQVIAPTLGGVFVDKATWRWCFWINLPLGGVTFLVILLFFKLPDQAKKQPKGFKEFLDNFDLIGTLLLIPWVICLLLALQWGGSEYAWSNWRIVLCWCIFAICFILWGFIQYREGDKATVPLRIMSQRTMIGACWMILLLFSLLFIDVYYIPIWLQAVKGHSAYQSGVDLLASSASMSVATIVSGVMTSQIGYYVPQLIASSVISSIAGGLIYSFTPDTNTAFWAASLVLMGLGVGLGGQQCIIAAQTVFEGRDIALATSLLVFLQTLGGTVFLAVAQNIFSSRLVSELRRNVPNVNPAVVIEAGASGLADSMRKIYPDSVDGIIGAYNRALQNVFLVATVLGCLTVLGIAFIEWKSVKKSMPKTEEQGKVDGNTEK
ncbi:major facilitator superfamily transporter [Colletotrichum karsti]|uniref:Major facilitator superfamily transporter n=1 Tax=Colletotrichum karsti TaxID=1095194 RepID=A0A9P6I5J6_9PEZI|nr:major facilitator superfamily transporter [Colletotrichum karsti]KAF9872395.1 major facilitator superfamily transporter [Colletotrichum karsti]